MTYSACIPAAWNPHTLETAENRRQLKQQEAAIYQRSQESATELFKLDFASYLEVLSVMEKSLEAELEYASLTTEYALTHVLLYRAVGGGGYGDRYGEVSQNTRVGS